MRFLLVAALLLLPAMGLRAETYPTRPIRFIVPYTPGGITDIVARMIGQSLSENLGQPVVIDNRAGAGGNIGAELAAKSPPDGYTLFMGVVSTHAVNVSLYPSLSYDPVKDFAPITLVATSPMVLTINPRVPAQTLAELVALAKAKPGTLNFASSGSGGASHFAGEQFKLATGIDIVHIPYRGTAPAVTDLLSGHVQMYFDPLITALPNVQAGSVRALAVTGSARVPSLPNVPTVAEAGFPAAEFTTWLAILTTAKTPPDVLEKLNSTLVTLLKKPDMRERMAGQGLDVVASTPEELATFMASETKKMAAVVKASGAKND